MAPPKIAGAAGGVRADAVRQHRNELLVLRARRGAPPSSARPSSADLIAFMLLLLTNDVELTACRTRETRSPDFAASMVRPRPSRRCAPDQCGNGHSRSFSLPICHSRASPCGSTIRKKMISAAEHHQLEVGDQCSRRCAGRAVAVEERARVTEEDRQQRDERRAEERAEDRADAADDDHEQDAERQVEVERLGLDRAEVGVREQRAGDAAVERADRERQQLRRASAGCRSPRPRRPCRAPPSTRGRSLLRTMFFAASASTATIDSTSRYFAAGVSNA